MTIAYRDFRNAVQRTLASMPTRWHESWAGAIWTPPRGLARATEETNVIHLLQAAGAGYALCRTIDILITKDRHAWVYGLSVVFLFSLAMMR